MIPLDKREALILAQREPGFRGICAECGCTEMNACTGQGILGDETCSWANQEQTLCSNPECLKKNKERQANTTSRGRACLPGTTKP
jgi:hypothetical protein